MANFSSEPIRNRVLDEEPEHPIGVPGSEHLIRRLARLEGIAAGRSRFAVNLFSHIPSYATLIFDDEVYVYPYGYCTLTGTGSWEIKARHFTGEGRTLQSSYFGSTSMPSCVVRFPPRRQVTPSPPWEGLFGGPPTPTTKVCRSNRIGQSPGENSRPSLPP
jgi:hypothetical protein